jgi:hypothetical protein
VRGGAFCPFGRRPLPEVASRRPIREAPLGGRLHGATAAEQTNAIDCRDGVAPARRQAARSSPVGVLALQRAAGNAAVTGLLRGSVAAAPVSVQRYFYETYGQRLQYSDTLEDGTAYDARAAPNIKLKHRDYRNRHKPQAKQVFVDAQYRKGGYLHETLKESNRVIAIGQRILDEVAAAGTGRSFMLGVCRDCLQTRAFRIFASLNRGLTAPNPG